MTSIGRSQTIRKLLTKTLFYALERIELIIALLNTAESGRFFSFRAQSLTWSSHELKKQQLASHFRWRTRLYDRTRSYDRAASVFTLHYYSMNWNESAFTRAHTDSGRNCTKNINFNDHVQSKLKGAVYISCPSVCCVLINTVHGIFEYFNMQYKPDSSRFKRWNHPCNCSLVHLENDRAISYVKVTAFS